MEETKIHVLDEEVRRVWRGRCRSEPGAIAAALRKHAPEAVRMGVETGPLTTWLWTELIADGWPMVCLDARHAEKALDMKVNKTDANGTPMASRTSSARPGAGGGRWRPMVSRGAGQGSRGHAGRGAGRGRQPAPRHVDRLSNQIRGIMETFGLVVPKVQGGTFERNVRDLLARMRSIISCPSSMRGVRCAPGPPSSTASSLPRASAPPACC